jgi:hypothetical protein
MKAPTEAKHRPERRCQSGSLRGAILLALRADQPREWDELHARAALAWWIAVRVSAHVPGRPWALAPTHSSTSAERRIAADSVLLGRPHKRIRPRDLHGRSASPCSACEIVWSGATQPCSAARHRRCQRRASMRCRVEWATKGSPRRSWVSSRRSWSEYLATVKSGTHHTHFRRIQTTAPMS